MTASRTTGHDRARLAADLAAMGPLAGRDVLVHCSMRRLGAVAGGPATLLAAIHDVLGPAATIVVPTHTSGNSTTSTLFRTAARTLTPDQVETMEARLPAFDRRRATTHGMGALAEHVRRQPAAVRSDHPQTSFAALGPRAHEFMAVHDLRCHLGDRSPLGTLYAAGASVLLLGVGYESCTAFHLAEYRLPWEPPARLFRCYVVDGGRRTRLEFTAPDHDASDFPEMGAALDGTEAVRAGRVGNGHARVVDLRAAVDFATQWLTENREPSSI